MRLELPLSLYLLELDAAYDFSEANVYKIKDSEKFGVAKDGALIIACLIRLNASCSS